MFETTIAGSLPKPGWLAETKKLWPAWRGEGNPLLWVAVGLSLVFLVAVVYVPALHDSFGTVALGGGELAIVAVCALAPAIAVEAVKALRRR